MHSKKPVLHSELVTEIINRGYLTAIKLLQNQDLSFFNASKFCLDYHKSTKTKDHKAKWATLEEYSYLQNRPDKKIGHGVEIVEIVLYKTRNNIEYVNLTLSLDNYGDLNIIYVEKGKYLALYRYMKKQNEEYFKVDRPVLNDKIQKKLENSVISLLKQKKHLIDQGLVVNKGILLCGPPGTGKSMFCEYLRYWARINDIIYGSLTNMNIKDNEFDALKCNLVFIDDIDLALMSREEGMSDHACAFLSELNGLDKVKFSIRIFTSNEKPDMIDKAFLRPGRIDEWITFSLPDDKCREEYFKKWPTALLSAIDIKHCINTTVDMSFADIEAVKRILILNHINKQSINFDEALNRFREMRELKSPPKYFQK